MIMHLDCNCGAPNERSNKDTTKATKFTKMR